MQHHYPKNKNNRVASEGMDMANRAKDNSEEVEQTQGGAEQPQVETEPTVTELEALATETEVPSEPVAETPQVTEAPVAATTVAEVKRTPSVIAETNQQKAATLRTKYAPQLDAIGNNMSEKIRLLHREGLSKGDISRVLQIQFQFVRNVVFNADMKRDQEAQAAAAQAAAEASKAVAS